MWFETREIESVLQKVVDNFLIPRFNDLNMNATGEWLESLEIKVGDDAGSIYGRDYSEQLAKGRKPGKLPPYKPMLKWVNAKLGIYGEEAIHIAYAIAKKIEKEGTSWYQKGGSDLIEVLNEPKTIEFIQNELSGILKTKIADRLVREAQEIFS